LVGHVPLVAELSLAQMTRNHSLPSSARVSKYHAYFGLMDLHILVVPQGIGNGTDLLAQTLEMGIIEISLQPSNL
jgi:hypothetical protein